MTTSIAQLAMAHEYISGLFSEFGLAAYLFEIEPLKGEWELKVECAIKQGWTTVSIALDSDALQASYDSEPLRQRLIDELKQNLCDCTWQNNSASE